MLPTDPKIRSLSPFQSLWLYTHIIKEKKEERDYMYNLVKLVCTISNPSVAKAAFNADTQEQTVNDNFENDLKSIDPNFKMDEYKEFLEDN